MKTDAAVQRLVDRLDTWPSGNSVENGPMGKAKMTKALHPYTSIFSPITINRLAVKNRLVMAPMGNIDMCEETGRPNEQMIQYFIARARGGVGLITTGLIPISHGIDTSITELGQLTYFPRIDRSRTVLSGWRDLAQGVHCYGSRIFVQLTPGLGRVGNPQCLINSHTFPVSASLNPNFYIPQIPCMPLSGRKLRKIIKNTGQAAADAQVCGLDGVYLHGHEGYLLEQMTNPAFNRRKLGRYSDWQAFGIDLIREIRRRAGDAYPIMYRIDLSLALNETYGETGMKEKALRKFKNGRLPEETLVYMKNLVKAGVDMFDVDLGCYDNWWLPHPPSSMPAGCFLDVAERVKKYFKDNVILSNAGKEVPVVAVGKLGYPDLAESALREAKCDMIMLGRPLLADPDWPNKAYAGRVEDIRPCIGCQEGCINEFVEGGHPQCAVNPQTGFEYRYGSQLTPAQKQKNIAIVGAGPAGIICAVTAAQRGHKVTLYEKTSAIGGRLNPGSVPKIKFDVANYKTYLENLVQTTAAKHSLTLRLNTDITAEELGKASHDVIVCAVGTQLIAPPFEGLDVIRHVQAVDLFMNPSLMDGAANVTIVGGGVVGCEMAEWLSYEHGKKVTVVEMLSYFMEGACTANRGHLIHALKKNGVALMNCAKVECFSKGTVHISRKIKNVPNPYNTWQPILPKNIPNPLAPRIGTETQAVQIASDLVVLALGGRADTQLFYKLQAANAAGELYTIADSFTPGKVLEAVRAAYALGGKL